MYPYVNCIPLVPGTIGSNVLLREDIGQALSVDEG